MWPSFFSNEKKKKIEGQSYLTLCLQNDKLNATEIANETNFFIRSTIIYFVIVNIKTNKHIEKNFFQL